MIESQGRNCLSFKDEDRQQFAKFNFAKGGENDPGFREKKVRRFCVK